MLRFLLKSAFRAAESSYNTPERKGARGEKKVHKALTAYLDENEYRVISDITLPTPHGTTQIDHLLLSRYGIFVIETKNMSGWIFGRVYQHKWTQVLKGGKRQKFQNPLRQNYAHIKAVQEVLDVDQSALHNIVVFTGTAQPKTEMPADVAWGLQGFGRLIGSKRKQLLTEAQVTAFANKLYATALDKQTAHKTHLENLSNKTGPTRCTQNALTVEQTALSCSGCGSKMVKRTNRKTNQQFWGCSSFPKCRRTLPAA